VCTGSCILFLCWLVSPQKVQADSNETQQRGASNRPESQVAVIGFFFFVFSILQEMDGVYIGSDIFYSARAMDGVCIGRRILFLCWYRYKRSRQ